MNWKIQRLDNNKSILGNSYNYSLKHTENKTTLMYQNHFNHKNKSHQQISPYVIYQTVHVTINISKPPIISSIAKR